MSSDELIFAAKVDELYAEHIASIDEGEFDRWLELFTEDCHYEIKPRENEAAGLPIPLLLCRNRGMLVDRIVALKRANIYQPHVYRHFVSGRRIAREGSGAAVSANYLVIQTLQDGESRIYQAGRYRDEIVEAAGRLRFRRKVAIYDTSRVQTLLVTPV
jgi:anthranilate 1,2-dioxygenase small subunit